MVINIDPIDQMLQGDDQTQASQAEKTGQVDDLTTEQSVEQQTPEEIAFNSLTGSAQDRIRQLVKRARTAEEQLQSKQAYIPPAPGSQFIDPNEQAAIQTLAAKGITTDEKLNKTLDDRLNALRWENEQYRLEGKYPGQKGPKYVRDEVEDFIQSHPQYRGYAPEDVFRFKMFPDEFLALELEGKGTKTGRSQTLKPTRTQVREETLTPEYIMERTDIKKYPDALQWQEEHRQEIDKVLQSMVG